MPNTGEITEDYPTYAKHMITSALIGFILGVIAALVGIYTKFYQQAGAVIWKFCAANWIVPVIGVSFIMLVVFVYFKTKSTNKHH